MSYVRLKTRMGFIENGDFWSPALPPPSIVVILQKIHKILNRKKFSKVLFEFFSHDKNYKISFPLQA